MVYGSIVLFSFILSLLFFFFFQAEDGIRDLVRSRGLGDVYKRQAYKGEEFQPTGNVESSGGLKWREVKLEITAWIAEKDGFGNQILENV